MRYSELYEQTQHANWYTAACSREHEQCSYVKDGVCADERHAELEKLREEYERTRELVRRLTSSLNRCSDDVFTPDFIEEMSREHRTLQQNFTGLCLSWFEHLSKLSESQYDGRNAASVQAARRIVKALDGQMRLPFI
jgi:hypothetical protein